MEANEKKVSEFLDELSIEYKVINHPPVYTCEELSDYMAGVEGAHCKNLFLRNKKGNRHFLVAMEDATEMNIKAFGKSIGVSNLSFASPERLVKHLGLTPGAVSIFGLINDVDHKVEVYLDANLLKQAYVNFHPNVNTATYQLAQADFKKYLDATGNKVAVVDFEKI